METNHIVFLRLKYYDIDDTAFWIGDLGTPMPRLGSGMSSISLLPQVCFYFIYNLTLAKINEIFVVQKKNILTYIQNY